MTTNSSATRALALEYKGIMEDPVEGFRVKLLREDDLFNWEVAIFGPPETPYQGGYFKAHMKFPKDYPYSPPTIRFLTKVWHPNVYENGDLCISILHPPVTDPQSGEDPSERWNPTQNVRTILLSVISLLNEPNTYSPANVDSSVMYRRWKDSKGVDKEYENIIRHQVNATKIDAERDNIVVPLTQEEWCMKAKANNTNSNNNSITNNNISSSIFSNSINTNNNSNYTLHSSGMGLDASDFYLEDDYDTSGDESEITQSESDNSDNNRRQQHGGGHVCSSEDDNTATVSQKQLTTTANANSNMPTHSNYYSNTDTNLSLNLNSNVNPNSALTNENLRRSPVILGVRDGPLSASGSNSTTSQQPNEQN